VEQIYPNAIDKLKFNEALKRMLNRLVGDLICNTQEQIRTAGIRDLKDVRAYPDRLARLSREVEEERLAAKQFLYSNLYFSATLDPEKNDAERVITELFEFWMKKPETLPSSYRNKAKQEPLPRVICDYTAGMTDNYIYEQYEKFLQVVPACQRPSREHPTHARPAGKLPVLFSVSNPIHHPRRIFANIHCAFRPDS